MSKITLQNFFSVAEKIATEKQQDIHPEHLFLGALLSQNNEIHEFCKYNNVNIDTIHLRVESLIGNIQRRYNFKGTPKATILTTNIIVFAKSNAINSGKNNADGYDLLVAFLSITNNINLLFNTDYNLTIKNMIEPIDFEEIPNNPINPKTTSTDKTTPALDMFCTSLTDMARKRVLDPVVGRKKEIKRLAQILSRRKKNNPVLLGQPGVGKTAIGEGLAQMIIDGTAPKPLMKKEILILNLSSIVAGTKFRGQFEERMVAIVKEMKENPHIILFLDEIHTLVGSGNSSGAMDGANILKPALARGEFQCIGATTPSEYRKTIEKDGALARRFQEIIVNEPSVDETYKILTNIQNRYEEYHHVKYTSDAIKDCVTLSKRYINERFLPDKAIDILDEAGASTHIENEIPADIKQLQLELVNVKKAKGKFITLEDFESAANARDKEISIEKDVETKLQVWLSNNNQEPVIVDSTLIRETISSMTNIPLQKLNTENIKYLRNMNDRLNDVVKGQTSSIDTVTQHIIGGRFGIKLDTKPIGSFIFLGPTGVGKTLLAKKIAAEVFGSESNLIRLDMSEYGEKFNSTKLFGAPPGYLGHESAGQLTEKIRKQPYSVVLFDEIEKAHPSIFDTLLQVLDEGKLTDSHGRSVNFKNTVIIMTSNIGIAKSEDFSTNIGFDNKDSDNTKEIILSEVKKKFKPEFLNRLDDILIFNKLSKTNILEITEIEINKLKERLVNSEIYPTFRKNVVKHIAEVGFDPKYGARPILRAISKEIEDNITKALINDKISIGDKFIVEYINNKINIKK